MCWHRYPDEKPQDCREVVIFIRWRDETNDICEKYEIGYYVSFDGGKLKTNNGRDVLYEWGNDADIYWQYLPEEPQ